MSKYNTIKVYNYPDHKPTQYKKYIVWNKNGECDFAKYNVVDDVWWLMGVYALEEDVVIAWADPDGEE